MGRDRYSRGSSAQPATHESTRRPRGDGRLDPVRWRRPGRGTLFRLAAVAALLVTAAAVLWSPPPKQVCVAGVNPALAAGARSPGGADQGAPASASPEVSSQVGGGAPAPAVPEGRVGVPIRLADPTALGLVHPGNRVDLLRIDDAGRRPTAVAGSALVLRVTGVNDLATGGLLLALTPQEADQAVATSRQGFAIVIRPG